MLVYDASSRAHEEEVGLWFDWFVKTPGVNEKCCLVLAHSIGSGRPGRVQAPRAVRGASFVTTNFDEGTTIDREFVRLLERIRKHQSENSSSRRSPGRSKK